MRRKISPNIKVSLTEIKKNQAYQIVGLGKIKRDINNKLKIEIEVHFQPRYLEGNQLLYGNIETKWLSLYESVFFKVGSLWQYKSSKSISLITASNVYSNYIILDDISTFKVTLTTLEECFPGFKFIPNLVSSNIWKEQSSTPYYKFEKQDVKILISSFELLRALFYRGPSSIDYLFNTSLGSTTDSNSQESSIGGYVKVVDFPTAKNDFSLEVILNSNSYAESDIRLLSELRISESFNFVGLQSHSNIISYPDYKSDEKYLYCDINQLKKKLKLKVYGLKVQYAWTEYFIVTSIGSLKNLYSFKKLKYDFEVDNRKGKSSNEDSKDIEQNLQTISFVPTYNPNKPPSIDSSVDGHSLSRILKCDIETGDDFDLPEMERDPKLIIKAKHKFGQRIFEREPAILSQTNGGSDDSVAQAEFDINPHQEEEVNQMSDFTNIVRHLSDLGAINRLELNSSKTIGLSNFPFDSIFYKDDSSKIRLVGIAEIVYLDNGEQRYFYFIHIFESFKRAALLFNSNISRLKSEQLNSILAQVGRHFGNWTSFKRNLDERKEAIPSNLKLTISLKNIYQAIKNNNGENIGEKLDPESILKSCQKDVQIAVNKIHSLNG